MKNDVLYACEHLCVEVKKRPRIDFRLQLCVLVTVEILFHQPAHDLAKSVSSNEKKLFS